MESETVALIKSDGSPPSSTQSDLFIFLLAQFTPLFLFALDGVLGVFSPALLALIALGIAIPNFIGCQRILGRVLVGLSWRFDFSRQGGSFWVHEVEPDPFVPAKLNANCFWIGLGVSGLVSGFRVLRAIVLLPAEGLLSVVICAVICALHALNFAVFFKVRRISSKQKVEAVRVVLLGNGGAFPEKSLAVTKTVEHVGQKEEGEMV
jgi:hypothetical protein